MRGGVSGSQPRRQQASGVALEDEQRMIHVLVIGSVEDAELLLAMRGIVGGVDVQQDLAALVDLLTTEANELIHEGIVQLHQIASGRGILPATERRLRAERFSQLLIGDDLDRRGLRRRQRTPTVCVMIPPCTFILSRVAKELDPIAGQMMALVEGP